MINHEAAGLRHFWGSSATPLEEAERELRRGPRAGARRVLMAPWSRARQAVTDARTSVQAGVAISVVAVILALVAIVVAVVRR